MSINPVRADMSKISPLRLGAMLEKVYLPENKTELAQIRASLEGEKPIVLGGLSNTLVTEDIGSPFILTTKMKGTIFSNNYIYVSSGENLANLCRCCCQNELGGLENISGIPGTVGGAIKNNSGSYGSTVSDRLDRIYVYKWDMGETVEYIQKDLSFGYRYSNLRTDADIILGVSFILEPDTIENISAKMAEVSEKRRKSQPKGRSIGSIFKRYGNISPGYYIEKCGLKGYRYNGLEISSVHANFIINNSGCVKDYLYLINLAKTKVYEKFGIMLEEEVRIIGARECL